MLSGQQFGLFCGSTLPQLPPHPTQPHQGSWGRGVGKEKVSRPRSGASFSTSLSWPQSVRTLQGAMRLRSAGYFTALDRAFG